MFIKKIKSNYFLVSIIVVIVSIICYCVGEIYPFGDKTVALYDFYWQHCNFLNLLFDCLEGRGTLAFSNYLAGGATICGYWLNLLMSPIYLICLLFGRSNILYSVNLLLPSYLILIALSMCYFINKKFPNLKPLFKVIIPVFYAFSGYTLFDYNCLTWLGFLLIMPFLVLSFEKLIKGGKMTGFVVCTVLMLITSFNVGASAQIILLVVYYLYIILCVEKDKQKQAAARVFLALSISLFVAMIMIAPSYFLYSNSGRQSGFFDYLFNGDFMENTTVKVSYLLVELPIIITSVIYFVFCDKKNKSNFFLILLGVLLYTPVFFDLSLKLLCFGSYQGFAVRLFFINTFFVFYVCCKSMEKYQDKIFRNCVESTTQKTKLLLVVGAFCLIAISVISLIINYDTTCILLATTQASSRIIIDFFLMLMPVFVAFAVIILFKEFKKIDLKVFVCAIVFLLSLELMINAITFISPKRYHVYDFQNYLEITKTIPEGDNVKFVDFDTVNKQLNGNVMNFSTFSSMISKENIDVYNHLGYNSANVKISDNVSTAFSDCVNSINYYISKKELNYKYLDFQETKNDCYIYKNTLSFPMVFKIYENYQYNKKLSMFENLNNFANALGLEGELFTIINGLDNDNLVVDFNQTVHIQKDGQFTIVNNDSSISISYLPTDDGIIYFCYDIVQYASDLTISHNEYANKDVTYGGIEISANQIGTFELDYMGKYIIKELVAGFMHYDKLYELYDIVKNNSSTINYCADGFDMDISVVEDGHYFINKVALQDYNIKVNGEDSKLSKFAGFISLDLNAGQNNIEVRYSDKRLLKVVGIGLILCILGCISVVVYNHYLRNKNLEKFGKFVFVCYTCLVITLVFVMYFMTIPISYYRLFYAIFWS